jgi:hypothetical protein
VTGSQPGNGHFDPASADEADGLDDDAPLDPSEESAAALAAAAETNETLDERVEAVVEDLDGVERVRDGDSVRYVAGGRPFAVLLADVLEVSLDAAVARAALRTADTLASPRGPGWIAFSPGSVDRFALDRADAWVRSAHRRARGG